MTEQQLPRTLEARLGAVLALAGSGYAQKPIPSADDEDLTALVEEFASAELDVRRALWKHVTRVHVGLLSAFAVRMASLAVRNESAGPLRLGALAFALAADARDADWRDVFADFPPLQDAALRIPGGAQPAFEDAARVSGPRMGQLLRWAAPPRSSLGRALRRAKMRLFSGWKGVEAADGFRYVVENPMSEAELLAKIGDAPTRHEGA